MNMAFCLALSARFTTRVTLTTLSRGHSMFVIRPEYESDIWVMDLEWEE